MNGEYEVVIKLVLYAVDYLFVKNVRHHIVFR